MFDRLRRAKSFIHRGKKNVEKPTYDDLDLSETSHLRRNVPIDRKTLEQQNKPLKKETSRSQEHLDDQVLEQLRRINFGDSDSRRCARKSVKIAPSRNSEPGKQPADVLVNRSRQSQRSSSPRKDRSGSSKDPTNYGAIGNVSKVETGKNFDRNNPLCWSERSIQIIKLKSAQDQDYSTNLFNSDDDFLLNRKPVDLSYNFDRRNPAYVSDRTRKKDSVAKSGIKSFIRKVKGAPKEQKDWYDSGISGGSTCSSAASGSMERTVEVVRSADAEERSERPQSRKRNHNMTLDKSRPVFWSADSLVREGRKSAYDRLSTDGGKGGGR